MPELPEVQTVVNELRKAGCLGSTITGARVAWPRSVDRPAPEDFCDELPGCRVNDIRRRGKFIVLDLSKGKSLLIHLRMSGRLFLADPGATPGKHEHVFVDLDHGRQLRFHDTRKFGRFYLVDNPDSILGRLGPEPLGKQWSTRDLATGLAGRKGRLKPLLLNQTFIAGLGNIYVDEALWEARLHPCRRSGDLSPAEIRRLFRAIRRVLRRAVDNNGTTLGRGLNNFSSPTRTAGRNKSELNVFRRTHLPCPRCRTIISRIRVNQRSTHICQNCQCLL